MDSDQTLAEVLQLISECEVVGVSMDEGIPGTDTFSVLFVIRRRDGARDEQAVQWLQKEMT